MKAVTRDLPLYQSIAIRGRLVLTFMLGVALLRQMPIWFVMVPWHDVGPPSLRGAADVVSTLLYLLTLQQMALADLSAIMWALPLAVTLAAALVFREPLGWRRLCAIGVGISGVLLILRSGSGAFDLWVLPALAAGLLTVGCFTVVAAMRVGDVSFTAPFRYTSLIWAIMLGLVFFGEWPDLWT